MVILTVLHNRQLKDSVYREKFLKHCQKESIRIKNILANIKEKQNNNTSQQDQNVHTKTKEGHEDDEYYKQTQAYQECDCDGRTPLLIAAINGSGDEVLKLLISKDVDLEKCDSQDRSALYLACKGGRETTVIYYYRIVAQKLCIIEAVDCRNRTALHVSCKKETSKQLNFLLENESIINKQDNDGNCPLHIACKRGDNEIVNILILNGADVDCRNNAGRQPLHIACSKGHYEIVDLLLKKHAQINNQDNEGTTPLLTACKIGQAQITRLLLQNKADGSICDNDKRSTLHSLHERTRGHRSGSA
ncbi:unnamed protein product [Mytilus edulis]|uniref:Uncharacterized protein n=1 Tax=Mytilus edulis TaxID=6550 RepID=A0A8S3SAD1_MYTED|nr:unnamed protein product [Mytilus edulis]